MASKEAPGSTQQATKVELNLPTMSQVEEIMKQFSAAHVTSKAQFDAESLLIEAENILKRAALIVESFVKGTQTLTENVEDRTSSASFNSPFCTLKQISCKMSCTVAGNVNAHEITLSILHMLSSYTWNARAVMTLAAFALGYGEFWLLMQIYATDQLAKSVAILNRLPVFIEQPGLQKHQRALAELNNLLKATMEVIKCHFELENLPNYGRENVPALSKTLDHVSVDVYWVIRTVVACSTLMTDLTRDEVQGLDLSGLADDVYHILNNLKSQLKICEQQIGEAETEAYQMLMNLFQIRPNIMEVFKALCYGKSNVQQLIYGSSEVNFDVLKHKYVLLLISGPDISDNDLSTLKLLSKEIGNRGNIVWVPIVDQTTIDMERKFRRLGSEVSLYIVQRFLAIPGIKFIKEEWHFIDKPIVVVINRKVKVEHNMALGQIRGINSFPCFRKTKIDLLVDGICRCSCACQRLCVCVPMCKYCQPD